MLGMALAMLALTARPQNYTQTFTLQPGWNSLWLEVQPENNDASVVFAGLPLESAWTSSP